VQATINYDAYGNILGSSSGVNLAGEYIWAGRLLDPAGAGLYYNRARFYSPVIGRWTTEDPIGFAGGDSNTSRYVGNAPTNGTDPVGESAVGHHWVPVSVLTQDNVWSVLSEEARSAALGSYSGPTSPTHRYTTYGGVRHVDYNAIVREQMDLYIHEHQISATNPMTRRQMETFIHEIENGRNVAGRHVGQINESLKAFNDAIRQLAADFRGNAPPQILTIEQRLAEGRRYARSSRRLAGLLSIVAGWLLADNMGILAAASEPRAGQPNYFQRAMQALAEGDFVGAERNLFGSPTENRSGGFFGQLVEGGLGRAALNFQAAWDTATASILRRTQQLLSDNGQTYGPVGSIGIIGFSIPGLLQALSQSQPVQTTEQNSSLISGIVAGSIYTASSGIWPQSRSLFEGIVTGANTVAASEVTRLNQ
jgi:RHS repeat-associated protein